MEKKLTLVLTKDKVEVYSNFLNDQSFEIAVINLEKKEDKERYDELDADETMSRVG